MSSYKISYLPLKTSQTEIKTRVVEKWIEIRESPANQIHAVDRILISIVAALLLLTISAQIYMGCNR